MSLPTELGEAVLNNLGWSRRIIIPDLIRRISQEIEKASDEETKSRLREYRDDLRNLGILIDQLLGKIELDEETDPITTKKIQVFLSYRGRP